ncbi:MAG: hypothetical protein PWP65_228 [Clostridia bacterium]|nr:hypothetical protein [Clostridia bacterium]
MNEVQTLQLVGQLMAISARTAPKAGGKDFLELKILTGEELKRLADAMVAYGREANKKNFDRDGENVRNSGAVLLLALKGAQKVALDCGACGADRCAELSDPRSGPEFAGPLCAWRLIDFGIAIGSAVKTASILNVDNRIMYRIGVVARKQGLIEGEIVVGIPLSATGKNIYFDR